MKPVRTPRIRQPRPDTPCLVRNRITGRWLVGVDGPSWSSVREEAYLYPSRAAARTNVRSIGGAIPFSIVPAQGDVR